jgi:uncharacterized protein (UPF0332 family)
MAIRQARVSLEQASVSLDDALSLEIDAFPGLVINTSYEAMHFAASAVLQAAEDWAPIRKNEVVSGFGKYIHKNFPDDDAYGENLNYVFDACVGEDYGAFEEADVEQAQEILSMAEAFVEFCETLTKQIASKS